MDCLCRTPLTIADLTAAIHSALLWETTQSFREREIGRNGKHHPEILAHTKRASSLECGRQKSLLGGKWKTSYWALLMHCSVHGKQASAAQQGQRAKQQCCPGSGICSLKKINRNCWLALCLEFHWEKILLPYVCFLLCSEEQDCIGIHHCFFTLTETTYFVLISDLIRRN